MFALGLLIPIVLLAAVFLWSRHSQEGAAAVEPAHGRISLLTEAVSYVGAVLFLAGAGVALGQRWDELAHGTRLGLLATFALFFLGVGFVTSRSAEPAFVRLTSVVWLIGTGALAGALVEFFAEIVESSDETTSLVVAASTTAVAALLFAIHRMVLQHLALYVGVLVTAFSLLGRIDPGYPAWIDGITAWAIGLAWLALGARRLVTPWWVAMPVGMITALIAPSAIQENSFGAMFAVGIATAAGLMAFSVYGRFVPGLALGSFGLFAYVTGAVVHYFGETIGVPAALAVTGGVILLIAALTTKLARFTRTPAATPHPEERDHPPTLRRAS